ncbi:MAG: DUF3551 domain-containing protein [Acidobacteriota bacterium]|jgi:hypothetical protein
MTKLFAGLLAVTAAAAATTLIDSKLAHADVLYPWCALESTQGGGGATNCGFVTYQQCMATISGIGGYCYQNPAYPGRGNRPIYIPRGPRPGYY